jgi:sugar/nucleoside kinase (ribokinase family)
MAQRILVVGSVGLDTIRTPHASGTMILGGSASHFTNAASLLKPAVDFVGVVGEDFKTEHSSFLERKGADLKGLERRPGKTFHWEGYYEKDMNQAHTVKTELNVFETFDPNLPEAYRDDPIVFLANIDPVLQLRVLDRMRGPRLVVCDTMNLWIDIKKKDLEAVVRRVNVAVFNDAEIRQLTGIMNAVTAARAIISMGPSFVIVKRGEYGFLLVGKDELFCGPGMIVDRVVDPTGAGDSFAGGFVSYVARAGRYDFATFRKAVVYANLVASFNVQGLGVDGLDKVTFADVKKRLADYRKLTVCPGF